jgi:hypothetical protein
MSKAYSAPVDYVISDIVDPLGGEAENNGTFQVLAGEATVENWLKWRGLAY